MPLHYLFPCSFVVFMLLPLVSSDTYSVIFIIQVSLTIEHHRIQVHLHTVICQIVIKCHLM